MALTDRQSHAVDRLTQDLLASEARFETIINHSPDGILILDRAGIILYVNPATEMLFGRSAAVLTGEAFGWVVISVMPGLLKIEERPCNAL